MTTVKSVEPRELLGHRRTLWHRRELVACGVEGRQQYQSVENYLQLMANPATYATHTEIAAANQLYNIQVR